MKYVSQLSEDKQYDIMHHLINQGITGEDLKNAMNSKISDLEEIVKLDEDGNILNEQEIEENTL